MSKNSAYDAGRPVARAGFFTIISFSLERPPETTITFFQ